LKLRSFRVHSFDTAQEWWPMGRKIFGVLLVFAVIAIMLLGAEHYSASEGNLRTVLLGR